MLAWMRRAQFHEEVLLKSPLSLYRLARYFSASILNTAIGLSIIAMLYYVTKAPYVTIALSGLLGYLYSIFSFHYIAFAGKGRRVPYKKYALTYSTAFVLNIVLTKALMSTLNSFVLVQAIVLPLVVGLQWLTANLWVFKFDP
jgi:hypothetical protein